jgi:hypothetical protein
MNGENKNDWIEANDTELDRLINPNKSATMKAIQPNQVPQDRVKDITYYNPQTKEKIIVTIDENGKENRSILRRVRGTLGGNRINYDGETRANTADLEVIKTMLNGVISDGSNWCTLDIADFYLGTNLTRPEYMRINRKKHISDHSMKKFDLYKYEHNGTIIFEVTKGIYGLPQAGILAQQKLAQLLAKHGYHQDKYVPCLFKHETKQIAFSLVVDDFGVKYKNKEDVQHLMKTLENEYKVKIDWTGEKYIGITINIDREKEIIELSMPGYIERMLTVLDLKKNRKNCKSPLIYIPPSYNASDQLVKEKDLEILGEDKKLYVQKVVGTLLYYARIIDSTMLTAVNNIGSQIGAVTQETIEQVEKLLDYAYTYPNNKLVYKKSNMILRAQSDASYLSRAHAGSVAGGILMLINNNDDNYDQNGAIQTISSRIDVVVSSAGEAEYAAVFTVAKLVEWLRAVLEALGYKQPATKIICDNKCAVGLSNNQVKMKKSKAMDMRFHWVRDRIKQEHIEVIWQEGANNLADFFTKAVPQKVHQERMKTLMKIPIQDNDHFINKRANRANAFKRKINDIKIKKENFLNIQ